MGWWDAGILGGDGPLDWLGTFADACGVDQDSKAYKAEEQGKTEVAVYYGYPFTRERVEKHAIVMGRMIAQDAIGWQVFGLIAMSVGAEVGDENSAMILESSDPEQCEPVYTDEDRCRVLADFKAAWEAHGPGQVQVIEQNGLMGKIADMMGGQ